MDHINMTQEQLLEAVQKALTENEASGQEPTLTTDEVQQRFHLGENAARRAMRQLVTSGRFEAVWAKRPDWMGTLRPTPAIRLRNNGRTPDVG